MKQFLCLVLTSLLLVLFSCSPPVAGVAGSLTVNFSPSGIAARTILPDVNMETARYIVSGAGPGGAHFETQTTGTSVTVNKLAFGDWTVTVEARNNENIVIGSGAGSTTVHTGESSIVSVTVTPLAGYGTLDLTLNWTASDTEYPSIDAVLLPATGSAQPLAFTITDGNKGTFNNAEIQAGYYTLIVKLLDNGLLAMGAVEVVRIVTGGVSTGTFDFSEINKPGGTIQVNITPNMGEPLTVSIDGVNSVLRQNQSMTASASIAEEVGNVTYVWYLNGESIGTGPEITLMGSAMNIGIYQLGVTAITADGTHAGSTSATFHVQTVVVP